MTEVFDFKDRNTAFSEVLSAFSGIVTVLRLLLPIISFGIIISSSELRGEFCMLILENVLYEIVSNC